MDLKNENFNRELLYGESKEESKNEESKNEESKNEESKNKESKNEESKNEESKNEHIENNYNLLNQNQNPNRISKKIINRQHILMNNYKKSFIKNSDFIWDNIFTCDDTIENKIYNLIVNPYQKKLNLINLILNSDISFPISNCKDIIMFFNWICPLNIEYKMGSNEWNYSSVKYGNKEKILVQNSISKMDMNDNFYSNYIKKIKNILSNSKIKYNYFEFKSKRFNKIKDIIWVFDKN